MLQLRIQITNIYNYNKLIMQYNLINKLRAFIIVNNKQINGRIQTRFLYIKKIDNLYEYYL